MRQGLAFLRKSGGRAGLIGLAAGLILLLGLFQHVRAVAEPPGHDPPATLQETGLYADFAKLRVDPRHLAYAPQYPLWTDGAAKRRWISLPPGTKIDASDPEAWRFPAGTRFWKEFSFGGHRVETRFIERLADGSWLFAAYAWSPDGREAMLVPERGRLNAHALEGGRWHAIPSVADCHICHEGLRTPVIGFSTLQLSPARDPNAPHAEPPPPPGVDLDYLVKHGLLVGLPKALRDRPPEIAAGSATERAALGYLHGNCGHCHNDEGPLQNLGMVLRYPVGAATPPAIASAVGQPVKKPAPGQSADALLRIERGHPERSAVVQRISSRYPALQMPPLGTEMVDKDAVELIRRWIAENRGEAQARRTQGGD